MDPGSETWSDSSVAFSTFKLEGTPNAGAPDADSSIEADVMNHWKTTGSKLGLKTDVQIARFLLDRFEAKNPVQEPTSCCLQCHSPLSLYCLKCQRLAYQNHADTSPTGDKTGITFADHIHHTRSSASRKQDSSKQDIVYITVHPQEHSTHNAPQEQIECADSSGTQEKEVIVIYDEKANQHVVIESPFLLTDGNLDLENIQFSLEDSVDHESRRNLSQTCKAGLQQIPSAFNSAVLQQTVTMPHSSTSLLLTEPQLCSDNSSVETRPQSGLDKSSLLAETRSSLLSTIKRAHNPPSEDSEETSAMEPVSQRTETFTTNSLCDTKIEDFTAGNTENHDGKSDSSTASVSHESSLSAFLEQIFNAEIVNSSSCKSVNIGDSSAVSVSVAGGEKNQTDEKGINPFSSTELSAHGGGECSAVESVSPLSAGGPHRLWPTGTSRSPKVNHTEKAIGLFSTAAPTTHSNGEHSGVRLDNPLMRTAPSAQLRGGHCAHKSVREVDKKICTVTSEEAERGVEVKGMNTRCDLDSGEMNHDDKKAEIPYTFILPVSGVKKTNESEESSVPNGVGPLTLASLSAQLRGERCEHKRVKEEKETVGNSVYKCTACGLSFHWRVGLMQHKCADRSSRPHICLYCAAAFSWKGALNIHMRVHTGQRPFICGYCGHSFKDRTSLTKHARINTGVRPYVCQFCGSAFHQAGALKKHVSCRHMDNAEKPIACEVFGTAFPELGKLRKHALHNANHRPYRCKDCSKTFTLSSHLKRHVQARHLGQKPYTCGLCLMAFSQKDTLRMHRKTHAGGKPFLCEQCGASFTHRKHYQQHACVKTYNCQDCEQSFFIKKNLLEHRRMCHPGKGPVACPLCPAVFKGRGGQLRQHMQTHRGPQKYVCHFCKAVFFYARSLKKHIDMKHTPAANKLPANVQTMMDKSTSTDVTQETRNFKTDKPSDISVSVSADDSASTPSSLILPISVRGILNGNDSSDIFTLAQDGIETSVEPNAQGMVDSSTAFKESSACSSAASTAFFESSTGTVNTVSSETSVSYSSYVVPFSHSQNSHLVTGTPVSITLPNFNTSTIFLQHSAAEDNIAFSDDSLSVVASQSVGGILEKVSLHTAAKASRSARKSATDAASKSFICKTCGARFGQLRYLKRHEQRKHSEVKKFVCVECQAGFIGKSPLLAHMRVHTGEKPFMCPDCPMAFTHYIQLLRHNKRYHPKPVDQKPVVTTNRGRVSQQLKQESVS